MLAWLIKVIIFNLQWEYLYLICLVRNIISNTTIFIRLDLIDLYNSFASPSLATKITQQSVDHSRYTPVHCTLHPLL